MEITPIAHIRTDFGSKFGVPRQSGLVPELTARIVFCPKYRNPDALRGLEDFSHLWLIWQFSEAVRDDWSPTVRPPRLGGNTRIGVFATRSPYRPNPLGLSCVRLLGITYDEKLGPILEVAGADLMDGTPIYDIKPYLPLADCRPDAVGGFAEQTAGDRLTVEFPEALRNKVPCHLQNALTAALAGDPRPAYQNDPTREYGFAFASLEVKFMVNGDVLRVTKVEKN